MVYDVGRVMHSARGARWCGCAVARAIRCGSASAPGTVVAFSTLHSEESLNARVVFPDDLHSVHYYNGETVPKRMPGTSPADSSSPPPLMGRSSEGGAIGLSHSLGSCRVCLTGRSKLRHGLSVAIWAQAQAVPSACVRWPWPRKGLGDLLVTTWPWRTSR